MDAIDKRILFYFLRDGRIPQRQVATLLGITPPSMNYRIKKLIESGVLRGFRLHVNPNFYGKIQVYVAFKNHNDMDGEFVSFKLKCLEWLNVYGVQAKDTADLKDRLSYMTKELGDPVMSYFPLQSVFRPSSLDVKIVEELRKDPRMTAAEVAENLGISSKIVEKHIRYLRHRGLIMVVPEIDLGKADIVIFSMFSNKIDEIMTVLQDCKVWQFTDGYAGITVCYADNMERAKKYISAARDVDKEADVMIVYDYVFK